MDSNGGSYNRGASRSFDAMPSSSGPEGRIWLDAGTRASWAAPVEAVLRQPQYEDPE